MQTRFNLLLSVALLASGSATADTLSDKAREAGCVSTPIAIQETLHRCATESGAFSYFNVPGISGEFRSTGKPLPPIDFNREARNGHIMIGMTRVQTITALGKPTNVSTLRTSRGSSETFFYRGAQQNVTVTLDDGRVTSIGTSQ